MADAATVSVLIQARDQASAQLQKVEGNMGKLAAGFAKHRRTIGMAATAIGGAITGIAALSVKSSLDQQIGIRRLDQSMKNVGTSYAAQKKQIEAVVGAIQNKTNFGDEPQREALQKLITIGGQWEGSLEALKITTDVAAGANIDLNAAALLVGKAIAGETSSLSRYGIILEKGATQTEIMAALTKQFGGAAEAAANPLTQMKNRMGDLFQVMGDALLPALEKLVPMVERAVRRIIEWAEAHPTLTVVMAVVIATVGALLLVLGPLLIMLPGLAIGFGLLTSAVTTTTVAFKALSRSNAILLAITVAITAGILIFKNWDRIVRVFKATWDKIWEGLKNAAEKGVNFIIGLFNDLTWVQRKALAGMIEAAAKVTGLIPGMGDLADKMKVVAEKIRAGIPDIDLTAIKYSELRAAADEAAVGIDVAFGAIAESADKHLPVVQAAAEGVTDAMDEVAQAAQEMATLVLASQDFVTKATERGLLQSIKFERMTGAQRMGWQDIFDREMEANALATANKREQIMEDLNNALVQIVEGRVQEAMRIEAAAGTDRLVFEERLSQRITDVKERGAARALQIAAENSARLEGIQAARAQSWEQFANETTFNLNEAGITIRDILDHWSKAAHISVPELAQFIRDHLGDLPDTLTGLWDEFFARFGISIEELKSQVDSATAKAAELAGISGVSLDAASPTGISITASQRAAGIQAAHQAFRLARFRGDTAEMEKIGRTVGGIAINLGRAGEGTTVFGGSQKGHRGGVVQGSPGSDQLVLAQAGETIIPAGRGGAGLTVNLVVNGDINGMEDFEQKVTSVIRDAVLGGGFSGVLARA